MDPIHIDEGRLPGSDIDTTDVLAPQEPLQAPSAAPDTAASPESATDEARAEPENGAAARVTVPLAELAVTAPLPSRDVAPEAAEAAPGADEARPEPDGGATVEEPLAPGATLAGYTIERLLRNESEGPVFLATPPPSSVTAGGADEPGDTAPAAGEDEPPPWRYIAREIPVSAASRLERVVAAGVRAPGLLTPVALARAGGRAFVIGVELPGSGDQPAPSLELGERLRPVDALTTCSQLASALAALHRGALAHLHVAPDQVTLYEGRVYLGGVEDATPVTDDEEGQALYARDANFLARTVGALGGAGDVTLWDHDSSAQRSLREIAARGEAGGFTNVEEVAEASSLALQTLMVAGARMGADVRAVRLRVTWGSATTVGRVRSENQDAWAATLFDIHDDAAADAPLGIFLVADGMGGEAHGEIASRLVARVVTSEMARRFLEPQAAWPATAIFTAAEDDAETAPQVPLAQALEQAVKESNRRTRAFGAKLNATTGSTITALAVAGARAALAHLGDSRAYLLRDGQLLQLTEDHSLLARLEAMRHPALDDPSFMVPRSVLYRSIGQEDDPELDMLQFVLAPDDRIVLCSDGLWDEVSSERIGQTLGDATDPAACAAELVAIANASGGHDNSTAVVVFVGAETADAPFGAAAPDDIHADAEDEAHSESADGPGDGLEREGNGVGAGQ